MGRGGQRGSAREVIWRPGGGAERVFSRDNGRATVTQGDVTEGWVGGWAHDIGTWGGWKRGRKEREWKEDKKGERAKEKMKVWRE